MIAPKSLYSITKVFVVISCFVSSCRTTEKAAVPCAEISVYKIHRLSKFHYLNKNKLFSANNGFSIKRKGRYGQTGSPGGNDVNYSAKINNMPSQKQPIKTYFDRIIGIDKISYAGALITSSNKAITPAYKNNPAIFKLINNDSISHINSVNIIQLSDCDTIILKTGNIILGRVTRIGHKKIMYFNCNNLSGSSSNIPKSDVSSVIYHDGRRDYLESASGDDTYFTNINPADLKRIAPVKQTEGSSIIGFLATLTGLLLMFSKPVLAIILFLSGFFLGKIAYKKIQKNPGNFKGKGLAQFSIIIGGLFLVAVIIGLLLLLTV